MKEIKTNSTNIVEPQSNTIETLQQVPKRCGWINEFLWSCAGVNKKVLRQCPSDYAKYAGIGGTILFTALMACLSGGYAMNFVFKQTWIAIAFGIFWGLLIFNLDRFIVNTMYSDGKHTISWGELKSGLPRILMAIFLGIVISTPLEMKIFEDEINAGIPSVKQNKKDEFMVSLSNEYNLLHSYEAKLDSLKNYSETISFKSTQRKDALLSQRKGLEENLNKAEKELADEEMGKNGSLMGKGPRWRALNDYAIHCKIALEEWDKLNSAELETLENSKNNWLEMHKSEINQLEYNISQKNNEIEDSKKQLEELLTDNGFALRYESFKKETNWETHPELAIVSLMITLLFVIIETAPTFFKMMMQDGAYDNLLNAEKHRVKVLSQQKVSDVNDYVNTEVKISTMKNQKRLEAEMLANEEILKKLAIVQAELLSKSIDAWREEELKKIAENPKSYLQVNVKPEINTR